MLWRNRYIVDGSANGFSLPEKQSAAAAKLLQLCPTLCDPIDGSPPGCPIPGILQARTLEGVAISFSNAWKWKVKGKSLSCVQLLATPWTAAYQAPPSMGFSRWKSSLAGSKKKKKNKPKCRWILGPIVPLWKRILMKWLISSDGKLSSLMLVTIPFPQFPL